MEGCSLEEFRIGLEGCIFIIKQIQYSLNIKQMRNNSSIQDAEQKKNLNIYSHQYSLSHDIEYSINSNFLKAISSKLFDAEISIMSKSNDLLDSLKNSKTKDMETTVDTLSAKQHASETEPRTNRFQRDRKLFTRKSPKNLPLEVSFQSMMRQVEQNCSKNTYNEVKRLMSEIKMLKKASTELQGMQRKLQSKTQIIYKLEQQNLQLNKRLQKQNNEIRRVEQQLKELDLKHKKGEIQGVQRDKMNIKMYIEDKEKLVQIKIQKLGRIEEKIQRLIMKPLQFSSQCSKCCLMLKKLKESISEYRAHLHEEGKQMDNLYNRYKTSIFTL